MSLLQVGTAAGIADDIDDMKINRQDFMMALDEVHPAFGVSEEELQQVVTNGIIHYDEAVEVSPPTPLCSLRPCHESHITLGL